MQASRLLAASGTLMLMTFVCGAVAHDINRHDQPYPAEAATVREVVSVNAHSTMSYVDEASPNDDLDDDATVP
jgi:hypothetical protein